MGQQMVATGTPDRCTAGTCWRRDRGGINTGGADAETGASNQVS
ncbi:hypothetical protein [Chitinophaga fulva]|nr:hypothetical protein [Chitinophaga fulva]